MTGWEAHDQLRSLTADSIAAEPSEAPQRPLWLIIVVTPIYLAGFLVLAVMDWLAGVRPNRHR